MGGTIEGYGCPGMSEEQKERWLPPMARLEKIGAFGLTEAGFCFYRSWLRYTRRMHESIRPHHPFTVEEYLAIEETATVKHEYVAGNIYAMTGATKRHNRIVTNILRKLADAAEGGLCQVYVEAVKLRAASDLIYYPDIMVACEPDDPLIENAPCLVVEVTSPNTEMTDRREKLLAYRQLPSLQAYLIVSEDRRWVEHHFRDESGKWQRGDYVEEGLIPMPCPPGAQLTLDDIYRGIEATS